jgi:hypothetical protein
MSGKKAAATPSKPASKSNLEAEIAALDAENEELLTYVEQLEEELTTAGPFFCFRCGKERKKILTSRLFLFFLFFFR